VQLSACTSQHGAPFTLSKVEEIDDSGG